ncbi:type II CAAX prenyl endopeptidase Rce1 family protein [Enterococcus gilvus]|uniref:CPBP family glutamic-type intramembrane protease n=1 Tax=Enterococcus gilvus TaxID=160453 RepID=UPI001C8C05A5|nr:CPBP family glutamic-type intramembrane protease [Enterococcus gilvus]MBX8937150.1 CPBP family intramembrane metalloprotease [Enterococcus gilvus]
MELNILLKLVAIPFYALIYNISLSNVLINIFQSDHFIIQELNALLILYLPILCLTSISKENRLSPKKYFISNKTKLFLGITFFLCLSICNTFIQMSYALTQFEMKDLIDNQTSFANILLSIPSSIIVIPVIEEIIFRRRLYPEVKKKFPRFYLLILTFSFMLSHFLQIIDFPILVPFYFIISLSLNLFYRKDENLFYNIIFHSLTNLTATLSAYYVFFIRTTAYIPIIIGSMMILIILLIVLIQKKII